METYALRLTPGQDLRQELEAFVNAHKLQAGLVLTCVGSLSHVALRLADADSTRHFSGRFEIVSLVGTLSRDGAHLHLSMSDPKGITFGGHLMAGSLIYTTAEIVLAELSGVIFHRSYDPNSGYDELVIDKLN